MSTFTPSALPSTVTAAAPSGVVSGASNPFGTLLFLLGFAVLFYLMVWRPQNKRAKEQQQLLSGLSQGDEVVTTGGILGKITRLVDDYILLELAPGMVVKMQKSAVYSVLPKGTLKGLEE